MTIYHALLSRPTTTYPWKSPYAHTIINGDIDNDIDAYEIDDTIYHISMLSCQKGPTRHAYAWQIGPFWQDTLDIDIDTDTDIHWNGKVVRVTALAVTGDGEVKLQHFQWRSGSHFDDLSGSISLCSTRWLKPPEFSKICNDMTHKRYLDDIFSWCF